MPKRKNLTGIQVHGGKLRIWFIYDKKRFYESLNLTPTETNQRAAAKLRNEICEKIRHGVFNFVDYFPESTRIKKDAKLDSLTFGTMVDIWMSSQFHLAKSTLEGYRKTLNYLWLPKLKNRPITEIKYNELIAILGAIKFKTPKTRNNTIIPIRRIFEAAYQDNLITSNPSERLIYVKRQKKQPDPLTLEEVELVLSHLEEYFPATVYNYFEFAFFTGLRTSEQIALRWGDVDFNRSILQIQRSKVLQEINERTKTYVAREVEMNSRALAALQRQSKLTIKENSWVFLNPNTGEAYLDDRPMRRWVWTPTLRDLGLRHRACYQTRHTYATFMLMSGANPAWAANQLGHSIQMFLSVYSRWITEADKGRELSKLETILKEHTKTAKARVSPNSQKINTKCANSVPKIKSHLLSGCIKINKLVEAGGIEPPSASTPPQGLHAYPAL
jgi:integrase